MFAQGSRCFFCEQPLSRGDASIEHLVASANGGSNDPENCVACCKAINALFGSMSLKEKIQVVLNQRGSFKCPNGNASAPLSKHAAKAPAPRVSKQSTAGLDAIVADLRKRGAARPRTMATLSSAMKARFKNVLADTDIELLLKQLEAKGVIVVTGTKVSYELS